MGFGNSFGDGGGFFGFDTTGPPPPPFGSEDGYCNLNVTFIVQIISEVIRNPDATRFPVPHAPVVVTTTASVNLYGEKKCEDTPDKEEATLDVTIHRPSTGWAGSTSKPKNHKELCKAFDGIESSQDITPDDTTELLKDVSNATNEIEGDFGLGDFVSTLECERVGAMANSQTAPLGRYFYQADLTCKKNLGTCRKGTPTKPSDCNEFFDISMDVPGPINIWPFGYEPNINPCDLAKLLECWKENPDADTDLDTSTTWDLVRTVGGGTPPQHKIDKASAKAIAALKEKCEKKK